MWNPEEEQPFTLEDEPSTPTPDGSPSQHSTHSGLSTFGPRNGYAPAGGLPASSQVCQAWTCMLCACRQYAAGKSTAAYTLALTYSIPYTQPQHDFESAHVNHTYTAAGIGQQRILQAYAAHGCRALAGIAAYAPPCPFVVLAAQTGSGSTSQRASTICRPTARCIGSGCGVNLTGRTATLLRCECWVNLLPSPGSASFNVCHP